MNSNKKTTIMLITSTLVLVLLITIGLSFAYFTASIEGEELGETITVTGGRMKIHYDTNDSNINITNVVPQDGVIATKEFTLTGDSTTNLDMYYQIHLVIVNNGFTDDAIQYKLSSVNTDDNGEVAPSITELKGIPTGTDQEVFLGNATFESPTEFNVHSYTLEFYFPRGEVAENENQGKTLEAYVSVREGHKQFLGDLILAQYGGKDNIVEAPTSLFSSTSTSNENAMYKMEDDYGMSYYYRGSKTLLSNNLIFAEHQWKIVRINGDDSIRIIYNGECSDNECVINDIGEVTQIGKTNYNLSSGDNKFIGFMFGNASVPTKNYNEAHKNELSSNIKQYIDMWYIDTFLNTVYEDILYDALFCNDRQLQSGNGYGISTTSYKAFNRLQTNKKPSIKCYQQNDRLSVTNDGIGNGDLTYPIALLTADEASIAGLTYNTSANSNYLNNGLRYWLLSPYRKVDDYAYTFSIDPAGNLNNYYVNYNYGVRPVINLIPETTVTGTGSSTDPFVVQTD